MKIVVLDGFAENPGDLSWDALGALGELTVYDRTPPELVLERIGDAQAIIINKIPITAQLLDACPSIRYVGVLATGYNIVDLEAANVRGIPVCNIPTYGTQAVAQFAFALLLEICHHVGDHAASVREGQWSRCQDFCYWNTPLIELADKTMGIIGFGRIGRAVGRIAQAMGMRVLAHDEIKDLSLESETCRYASLEDIWAQADVVSLHCPLTPATQGLIRAETIAKMKDGVIILNNARGPLIVEADLAAALNSGKVYAAGLDVTSTEPILPDNPLLTAKNCIITPHISWAPKESRQRLMDIAVDNLARFQAGQPVNVVNTPKNVG